jgi:hypothetical protein
LRATNLVGERCWLGARVDVGKRRRHAERMSTIYRDLPPARFADDNYGARAKARSEERHRRTW